MFCMVSLCTKLTVKNSVVSTPDTAGSNTKAPEQSSKIGSDEEFLPRSTFSCSDFFLDLSLDLSQLYLDHWIFWGRGSEITERSLSIFIPASLGQPAWRFAYEERSHCHHEGEYDLQRQRDSPLL